MVLKSKANDVLTLMLLLTWTAKKFAKKLERKKPSLGVRIGIT